MWSDKANSANGYPQRHHPTCVDSSSSTAKNALKEETGSDLLLTGNGRGGKCVRVIVAVSLVAVVALVVGVVLYATRRECFNFLKIVFVAEGVAYKHRLRQEYTHTHTHTHLSLIHI